MILNHVLAQMSFKKIDRSLDVFIFDKYLVFGVFLFLIQLIVNT